MIDETNAAYRVGFRDGASAMQGKLATWLLMNGHPSLAPKILGVDLPVARAPEVMAIGNPAADPPTQPVPRPLYVVTDEVEFKGCVSEWERGTVTAIEPTFHDDGPQYVVRSHVTGRRHVRSECELRPVQQ